jgi:hypothetical protein
MDAVRVIVADSIHSSPARPGSWEGEPNWWSPTLRTPSSRRPIRRFHASSSWTPRRVPIRSRPWRRSSAPGKDSSRIHNRGRRPGPKEAAKAIDAGGDDFIRRPLEEEEVCLRLRAAVARLEALDGVFQERDYFKQAVHQRKGSASSSWTGP